MADPSPPKKKKKSKARPEPESVAAPAPAPEDGTRLDEATIGRAVAIGLPIVTVTLAAAAGVMMNVGVAILVLASGLMLGAIGFFWGSLRVLSGEAPLPADMAELEAARERVDPLEGRRDMLLRALKDLEVERSIGKLDDSDFADVAQRYRVELRDVLRAMDESVAPHMQAAEKAVRKHFEAAGLIEVAYRGRSARAADDDDAATEASSGNAATNDDSSTDDVAADDSSTDDVAADDSSTDDVAADDSSTDDVAAGDSSTDDVAADAGSPSKKVEASRALCKKCDTSNEPDAAFCKKCGAKMREEDVDA
ncbi:MAG: zinc ribbon domain-containing protein [Polyangiaceae bacterium]